MKIFRSAQNDKLQPSLFFDSWAEGNEIKDDDGYIKPLYHGTFSDFDRFDISKSTKDNFFGNNFIYTSDSPFDVQKNYSSPESPDLTNKREFHKEKLYYDDDYWNELGIDLEDDAAKNEHIEAVLGKMFPNERGRTLELYGKMSNPVVLDRENPTIYYIDFPEENEEDESGFYESTMVNRISEAYTEALYDVMSNDEKISELVGSFLDNFSGDDYISATEIFDFISKQEIYDEEDDTPSAKKTAGQFFLNMGHDGIVLDAYEHFPDMIHQGVKHYMFPDPKQLKSSIGNTGVYDPNTSVLTAKRKSIFLKRNS